MAESSWKFFSVLLRPHRSAVASYGAFLAIATALPLSAAIVLQRFVDAAARRAPTSELATYAAEYALIGLISAAVTVAVVWRATALAWQITDGLRSDLAELVLTADLAFHRDHTRGDLVSRADDDVTAMAVFLSEFVARLIAIVMLALAATGTLLVVRPVLAGPFAVCVAVTFAVLWFQRNGALAESMEERDGRASLSGLVEERIGGAEDIASLGAGVHSVRQLSLRSERIVQAVGRRSAAQMRAVGKLKVALVLSEVVMLIWGAVLLQRGQLGIGAVVLGVRFATAIRYPVEHLAWRLQEVQGATGSATRVLGLLASQASYPNRTKSLPQGGQSISFENVGLTYDDGEHAVLENVTFTVHPGHSLGLVGRSGSGKTTIGRLALRLVEATEGTVRVGSVDITTITEASLRSRVTSIPQDVQIFPGTVRDNVTMFSAHSDDDLLRALADVGLDRWLSNQSQGLDTVLLSRSGGAGLSAGEAQLLALARALVRCPDVVILDEATSRIDPETQFQIAAATARLLAGRSSIVIAHRLETLAVCDEIAVLEHGRVVEYGDRRALLADPTSRFARLWSAGGGARDEDNSVESLLDSSSMLAGGTNP